MNKLLNKLASLTNYIATKILFMALILFFLDSVHSLGLLERIF